MPRRLCAVLLLLFLASLSLACMDSGNVMRVRFDARGNVGVRLQIVPKTQREMDVWTSARDVWSLWSGIK